MLLEKRINSNSAGNQHDSSAAGLTNGGYIVTWASDGSQPGIFAQRYDANSVKQGAEFLVNTVTNFTSTPSVTALNNGGYVIAWTSLDQEGDGHGIYAQRYNANGVAQSSEFRVNTLTTEYQESPSISTLADGGFVITWHSYDLNSFEGDIHGQRYNANGVPQGAEFRANIDDTLGDQLWGPVAALADGGFVVTWITEYQSIRGQRYDASGIAKGTEFHANIQNFLGAQGLSVAALNDGGFVVTWGFWDLRGIYGQRYDANGTAKGAEFFANTFTAGAQIASFVTGLADGGFVITWSSSSQDNSSTSDHGIYGQVFDANGIKKGGEFHANTFIAYNQINPQVTALNDGGFIVTWESENQDGAGWGVYAQRYDANGNQTNSLLTNTAGNDILAGSISDDNTVTYANSTAPIKVSLNISSQQNTIGAGLDTLTGIENLIGSNYSDILTGNGKDNALLGEAGNDTLSGFSGADTMIGGLGNDNYFVENAGDVIIENFNEGIDSVNSKITYLLLDNIENITLTGVSAINGAGNNQSNIIIGNVAANQLDGRSGNDKLMGGAGNDTLNGDNNNDTLLGEIGDDTLKGGAGIDKLDGGAGNNVLTGGVGKDIFKFTATSHTDIITDFFVADDTIQFENAVFTTLATTGTLAASQFRIGSKSLDANDFVIYNNVTGALLYDADGNGAIAAVQIATLSMGLPITSADIVVI